MKSAIVQLLAGAVSCLFLLGCVAAVDEADADKEQSSLGDAIEAPSHNLSSPMVGEEEESGSTLNGDGCSVWYECYGTGCGGYPRAYKIHHCGNGYDYVEATNICC